MKKLFYVFCFLSIVSCSNNFVGQKEENVEFSTPQERAFFGYDLSSVHEREVNIKISAKTDDELSLFIKRLEPLGIEVLNSGEAFREGEKLINARISGDYPKTLRKIREMPEVIYADPNYKVSFADGYNSSSPCVPIFNPFGLTDGNLDDDPVGDEKEYALRITEALRAYQELGYGDHTVWAGIVDTGTNANHVDLRYEGNKKVVEILRTAFGGYGNQIEDVTNGNSDYEMNYGGHGTHCTGSICAVGNNKKGMAGVAWKNVKFASYKGMMQGSGSHESIYGSLKDLANKVREKVSQEEQATVPVNLSLGSNYTSGIELEAINYAMSKGILPVIAMGNEGQNVPSYPAGFPGVLSVGATGPRDEKTGFSTSGSWINVCAPGLNIISLGHSSPLSYVYMSGTSMATPFVTGVVTYLLSFNPKLTPYQIIAILEQTADKINIKSKDPASRYDANGFSKWYGYGRVNVYKAAKMVKEGKVPPKGDVYVETVLTVKTSRMHAPIHIYDKRTGVLVTMAVTYSFESGKAYADFRGLRAGTYEVYCNKISKDITIGNENVTLEF